MKEYEIQLAETYARVYLVKAKNKKQAEKKYYDSDKIKLKKNICVESYINKINEIE